LREAARIGLFLQAVEQQDVTGLDLGLRGRAK